jgi:MoaA/NifB/PqqE/SkfB family radical SAM enzyme
MHQNKYSGLKILGFKEKIESFERGEITAPIYVRVKPTNVCNHGCRWCAYKHGDLDVDMHETVQHKDFIPSAKLFELFDDFASMGVKAVTFSGGGEPLLHKDIDKVCEFCLKNGILYSVITNGSMLKGAHAEAFRTASWVRISMDYVNAEQMETSRQVKGSQFETVIENINNFSRLKSPSCNLEVNFIVTRQNYLNVFDAAVLLKTAGVENVRFSPVWMPGFAEYHKDISGPVNEQLSRARSLIDESFTLNTTYNLSMSAHGTERCYSKCWVMQFNPVVAADQNVYACHNTAYSEHGMIGTIKDKSFKELWFSREAMARFDGLRPDLVCRHQCSSDSKNILVRDYLDTHFDSFV